MLKIVYVHCTFAYYVCVLENSSEWVAKMDIAEN